MDSQRPFLWVAFLFTAWLVYMQWMKDYGPQPAAPPPATPAAVEAPAHEELPSVPEDVATPTADVPDIATAAPAAPAKHGQVIHVETDLLGVAIDTLGGRVESAVLHGYPVHKKQPDVEVELLSASPESVYVLRSGLRIPGRESEPTHDKLFTSEHTTYELRDGDDSLDVSLHWTDGQGVTVTKTFTFHRGRYDIGLRQTVENGTDDTLRAAQYVQIKRHHVAVKRSYGDPTTYSFRGAEFYDGNKLNKVKIEDLAKKPLDTTVTNGWVGSAGHYFHSVIIPPQGEAFSLQGRLQAGDVYLMSMIGAPAPVAPGASVSFDHRMFLGPKLQAVMEKVEPTLTLTVDYGILTPIASILFWLLTKLHSLTRNWGWAIILLTLLVKLAFYKLSEISGKSMARMRKLQPRIKALQERYAGPDNRQKLSEQMMELYKREKVNPAAGCLPILVQMPVFFSLYWVLLKSVELRQANFALWLTDLSSKDPYFILPLLMGVTMFVQQKLNPAPPDPMQARVMMIMPVAFTGMFAFFPSGLVLYWLVNNLLTILQQWHINRVIAKAG